MSGKGSGRRPQQVPDETVQDRWEMIFGKKSRNELERECCGTFFRTPHRSTCPKFRGKKNK